MKMDSSSSAIWFENHVPIKLDLKIECAGAVLRIMFEREFANSRLVCCEFCSFCFIHGSIDNVTLSYYKRIFGY